jgi:hypothetical protein
MVCHITNLNATFRTSRDILYEPRYSVLVKSRNGSWLFGLAAHKSADNQSKEKVKMSLGLLELRREMKKRSVAAIEDAVKDVEDKAWYYTYVRFTKDNKKEDSKIRKQAQRAAAKIEKRYDQKIQREITKIEKRVGKSPLRKMPAKLKRFLIPSLLPKDELDWGMTLGKLSALRWVLGYEWDVLDT